jgi:hypothetical protein
VVAQEGGRIGEGAGDAVPKSLSSLWCSCNSNCCSQKHEAVDKEEESVNGQVSRHLRSDGEAPEENEYRC